MTNKYETCNYCGNPLKEATIWPEFQLITCLRCAQQIEQLLATNPCQICCEAAECEFETSTNPLPKLVMQTVRQGNAIMQTQIRNPERMKQTCAGCYCYNKDKNICCRGTSTDGSCEMFTLFLGDFY